MKNLKKLLEDINSTLAFNLSKDVRTFKENGYKKMMLAPVDDNRPLSFSEIKENEFLVGITRSVFVSIVNNFFKENTTKKINIIHDINNTYKIYYYDEDKNNYSFSLKTKTKRVLFGIRSSGYYRGQNSSENIILSLNITDDTLINLDIDKNTFLNMTLDDIFQSMVDKRKEIKQNSLNKKEKIKELFNKKLEELGITEEDFKMLKRLEP